MGPCSQPPPKSTATPKEVFVCARPPMRSLCGRDTQPGSWPSSHHSPRPYFPHAARTASNTMTSQPLSCRRRAAERPAKPAPNTMTRRLAIMGVCNGPCYVLGLEDRGCSLGINSNRVYRRVTCQSEPRTMLRVLTLNVWDTPIVSPLREERCVAAGRRAVPAASPCHRFLTS